MTDPDMSDRHAAFERAVAAVLDLMGGSVERSTNKVYEWPDDEAAAYRSEVHRNLSDQIAAVSRLRAEKIVTAVAEALGSPLPEPSPLDFTWDVVVQAMAVPRRAPHVFPDGPTADLVGPSKPHTWSPGHPCPCGDSDCPATPPSHITPPSPAPDEKPPHE